MRSKILMKMALAACISVLPGLWLREAHAQKMISIDEYIKRKNPSDHAVQFFVIKRCAALFQLMREVTGSRGALDESKAFDYALSKTMDRIILRSDRETVAFSTQQIAIMLVEYRRISARSHALTGDAFDELINSDLEICVSLL